MKRAWIPMNTTEGRAARLRAGGSCWVPAKWWTASWTSSPRTPLPSPCSSSPPSLTASWAPTCPRRGDARILLSLGFGLDGGHHPGSLLAQRRGALVRHRRGSGPVLRLQQDPRHPLLRSEPAPRLLSGAESGKCDGCPVPQCRIQRDHHLLLHQPLLLR